MENIKLKTLWYYKKNKKYFNKKHNKIWKRIAGPEYIGFCSFLFQKFYSEVINTSSINVEDFFLFYINYTNPIKKDILKRDDSKYYGRSITELQKLAELYYNLCNDNTITIEQCFDDIINHVIIETYFGQIREFELIKYFTNKGFSIIHTNGYWDRDLGVDFILKKDNKIVDYIQCKPKTAFSPNANQSCVQDRILFFKKESLKKEVCLKNNIPYFKTKFILYNSNTNKFCKNYNRDDIFFLLHELIDKNGKTIIDYKKLE